MLFRSSAAAVVQLLPLLGDADAEMRTQAARTLGDARATQAFDGLVKLLRDPSLRVQMFAAQSLGKLARTDAGAPIFAMLAADATRDAYLRHAGVMALARLGDTNAVLTAATNASSAVRMASLLVLRRWEQPAVAQFLADRDPLLVTEAAIAINEIGRAHV